MNSNNKIMPWIDILPGVEETNFQQLRDAVAANVAEADELVRKAEALRSESYFASCAIESDAKVCWSIQMVDVAKHAAGG